VDLGGLICISLSSEPPQSSADVSLQMITAKVPEKRKEEIRLKIYEGERAGAATRRDLMVGENPWNGTKVVADSSKSGSTS
jgi:hypothetical protein